jgi:hypothetical protein
LVSSAAMAAPMPLLAPVTTATRPDQRSISQHSPERTVGLSLYINVKTLSVHSSLYFWCKVMKDPPSEFHTLTIMLQKNYSRNLPKKLLPFFSSDGIDIINTVHVFCLYFT